jgi:hypothetical protein
MKSKEQLKSFTESLCITPVDWFKELKNAADENLPYSKELAKLSGSWVTCACGNQCAVFPRDMYGKPVDSVLESLGRKFHFYIIEGNWLSAMKVLCSIEERSSFLLDEIKKGKI